MEREIYINDKISIYVLLIMFCLFQDCFLVL